MQHLHLGHQDLPALAGGQVRGQRRGQGGGGGGGQAVRARAVRPRVRGGGVLRQHGQTGQLVRGRPVYHLQCLIYEI